MDAMTATAFGSGLSALGRGIRGYQQDTEEKRRYDASAAARKAEADEARTFRAEQTRLAAEAKREADSARRAMEYMSHYSKMGVAIDPMTARQLADADAEGPNAPPGTVDDMIAAATGATVPTGDEMAQSPVDNGYQANAGPVPARKRVTDSVRRALEASRMGKGVRVPLEDGMGFARDEDAFGAEQQRLEDEREDKMRRAIAAIAASGRSGAVGGAPNINALINDQEQVLGGVERTMPKRGGMSTIIEGQPISARADSMFRADSTQWAGRRGVEGDRLNALKLLRGDSNLMAGQGASPLAVGGRAPNFPGASSAPPTPANAGTGNPQQAQLAQQAQQAIAAIMAQPISEQEKQAKVAAVNARLAQMVRGQR